MATNKRQRVTGPEAPSQGSKDNKDQTAVDLSTPNPELQITDEFSRIRHEVEQESQRFYHERLVNGYETSIRNLMESHASKTSALLQQHESTIMKINQQWGEKNKRLEADLKQNREEIRALLNENAMVTDKVQTLEADLRTARNSIETWRKDKKAAVRDLKKLQTNHDNLKTKSEEVLVNLRATHRQELEAHSKRCTFTPDHFVRFKSGTRHYRGHIWKARAHYVRRHTKLREAMTAMMLDVDKTKSAELYDFCYKGRRITDEDLEKTLSEMGVVDDDQIIYVKKTSIPV